MKKHIQTDNQNKKFDVLLSVFKDKTQWMALIFSSLIMMGHFLIIPFINPYMEFNLGYSKFQTPMIYLFGGIASFFAANILGRLADKYGKLKVFTVCMLLSLPLVITITQLPFIPFSIVLALFAIWFSLATGRGVTAQALISNVVEPQKRGSFMSFNSSVQQLGTSAASIIAGLIVIKGSKGEIFRYHWVGYLSVFVLTIAIVLGYKIFRRTDKVIIEEIMLEKA